MQYIIRNENDYLIDCSTLLLLQYSCRDALSVRAFARGCASDSRVARNIRAILRDHLANAQNHLSNARRVSDMRDLYNLNNLPGKVCCKKMFHVEFLCPPDVNMYVKFDCIDYCLVPPSIYT